MPIAIDGGRIPNRLTRENRARSIRSASRQETQAERIRIALINNMPDSALEDTEVQFVDLLESAAGDLPVSLKLFSLPKVPRGDAGQQHLNDFYFGINELLNTRFDGMIMTGTEPRQPDLRDEPYWHALGEVLTGPNKTPLPRFCPAWPRTPAFCTVTAFRAAGWPTNSSACSSTAKSPTTG